MAASDIEQDFPFLTSDNYKTTSDEDFNYNCLAFALGDFSNWWEPPGEFGFYWPPGFASDLTVETVAKIINLHGYVVEGDEPSHALQPSPFTRRTKSGRTLLSTRADNG